MLFSGVGIYAPAHHSAEQKCVFTRGISENRRLLQDVLSVFIKAIPPNLSEQFECVKSALPLYLTSAYYVSTSLLRYRFAFCRTLW